MHYFETAIPGLWHETMRPDGGFVAADARASSLYHVTCAFDRLDRAISRNERLGTPKPSSGMISHSTG